MKKFNFFKLSIARQKVLLHFAKIPEFLLNGPVQRIIQQRNQENFSKCKYIPFFHRIHIVHLIFFFFFQFYFPSLCWIPLFSILYLNSFLFLSKLLNSQKFYINHMHAIGLPMPPMSQRISACPSTQTSYCSSTNENSILVSLVLCEYT